MLLLKRVTGIKLQLEAIQGTFITLYCLIKKVKIMGHMNKNEI